MIREDSEALFRFEIAATEEQLPTPILCRENQSFLKHILSSCNSKCNCTLTHGRYTWLRTPILLELYQQIRSVRNEGQAVLKLGLVQPACQIKFATDKGNQITAGKVEEKVPLF